MKKTTKLLIFPLIILGILVMLTSSCTKDESTPTTYDLQGPLNPGFEDDLGSTWISNYDYYSSITGESVRITGMGFMPTKGSYFLNIIWGNHRWDYQNWTGEVYQENVSFNSSSKMIFDYSLQGLGTAKILFTSNGTAILWTSTSTVVSSNVQKTSETITLPTLQDKGKLIIQFLGMSQNASFQMDNIRVQ